MKSKVIALLLAVNIISCFAGPLSRNIQWDEAMLGFPAPDGNLHIYAIPVGDGDATIIQCPAGDIIVHDMGRNTKSNKTGWTEDMVRSYLLSQLHMVKAVIVSNPTEDHYNYVSSVLRTSNGVGPNLEQIVIAGYKSDYNYESFQGFLNSYSHIVEMVNNGDPCISDCSNTPPQCNKYGNYEVSLRYLGANLGNAASSRSITLQVQTKNFGLLLPGDFYGTDIEYLIMQEWNARGDTLESTHYKVSNHGSVTNCNSLEWLQEIKPQYAFSSNSYPKSNNAFSPSCNIYTRLLQVGSLNKRSASGVYACAASSSVVQYKNFVYDLYTTAPTSSTTELLKITVTLCDNEEVKSEMKAIPNPF
nr:Hexaxilin-1 [Euplectella curvistellata]